MTCVTLAIKPGKTCVLPRPAISYINIAHVKYYEKHFRRLIFTSVKKVEQKVTRIKNTTVKPTKKQLIRIAIFFSRHLIFTFVHPLLMVYTIMKFYQHNCRRLYGVSSRCKMLCSKKRKKMLSLCAFILRKSSFFFLPLLFFFLLLLCT